MVKSATQFLFAKTYGLASFAYRGWHGLRHKELLGAQTAVWSGEQVLLIRNTYRDTYGFPGGYISTGEAPITAAQRELKEEVGIWCSRSQLRLAFVNEYAEGSVSGKDWIFETDLETTPVLTLDLREIKSAAFFDLCRALELPLEHHVKRYLQAVPVGQYTAQRRAAA